MRRVRLVIENLEPELSEWLYIEYSTASRYWGGATFTSVPPGMGEKLRTLGEVHAQSFRAKPQGTPSWQSAAQHRHRRPGGEANLPWRKA